MNAGNVTRLGWAGVQSGAKCNRKGIPGQLRTFARGNLYVGVRRSQLSISSSGSIDSVGDLFIVLILFS